MSLISALTTGTRVLAGADPGGAAAPFWDDRWFGGGPLFGSAAGMAVSPARAKKLATVWACVNKKATSVAMLPLKMYLDDGKGGSRVATNHPLYDVLYHKPNPLQTAYEFKWMMQSHVELRGNAFAEIVPGPRGAVDQLLPMHPDYVQVEQLRDSGRLRYRYNDPVKGVQRVLMQDEVFHLRDCPDNVVVGQSRIAYLADMLGLGLLLQDYQSRFLANDASPGIVFTGANFKSVEDEQNFIDSVKEARTGKNRGAPYLMPNGMDAKALMQSSTEMQLVDWSKVTDSMICTAFNVLPHTIGVDNGKAATFASTEQFNLMHVQQTVLPLCILWEQAVQRDLILAPQYFAKFSVAALMRGDQATRGKFYQLMASIGAINMDEIRALEDMNPIPDGSGKRFWNQLNWGLLNRNPALTTGALPTSSSSTDDDDDDEEDDQEDDTGDDNETDDEQASGGRQSVITMREQRKLDRVVSKTIETLVAYQRRRAA